MNLHVIDIDEDCRYIRQKQSSQTKATFHHAQPARVLIVVFVQELVVARVVRRVYVDALYALAVAVLQQVEGLEVFAVDKEPVGLLVQVLDTCQQPVLEVCVEELRVEDEVLVGL